MISRNALVNKIIRNCDFCLAHIFLSMKNYAYMRIKWGIIFSAYPSEGMFRMGTCLLYTPDL